MSSIHAERLAFWALVVILLATIVRLEWSESSLRIPGTSPQPEIRVIHTEDVAERGGVAGERSPDSEVDGASGLAEESPDKETSEMAEFEPKSSSGRNSKVTLMAPLVPGGEIRLEVVVTNIAAVESVPEVRLAMPARAHRGAPDCKTHDPIGYSDEPMAPYETITFGIDGVYLPESRGVGETELLTVWVSDIAGYPTDTILLGAVIQAPDTPGARVYDGPACASIAGSAAGKARVTMLIGDDHSRGNQSHRSWHIARHTPVVGIS